MLTLQVIGWLSAFLIFYVYMLSRIDKPVFVFALSISSFTSYILIIYGYAFYLYPRFYRHTSKMVFIGVVLLFFLTVVGLRLLAEKFLVGQLVERSIFDLGRTHLLYGISTCLIALIVGILLVSVFDNIARERREVILKRKQSEAELNLLKAQLQPHFLFNSLNNLYYDVYKTQPEVADRIAMLSNIMRYFMEESPEERILLAAELDFIRNYIELEQVRLPQRLKIEFVVEAPDGIMIPPMLLIPLVENLFKHGTSFSGEADLIKLSLQKQKDELIFTVTNPLVPTATGGIRTGVGLRNLRERLILLYGQSFNLKNESTEKTYIAQLVIPLS